MDAKSRTVREHPLRVAAVQMQSIAGNKDANFATIETLNAFPGRC